MNATIGTTVYRVWIRGHHVMLTSIIRNGRPVPSTDARTYRMMDDGGIVQSGRTGHGGGYGLGPSDAVLRAWYDRATGATSCD